VDLLTKSQAAAALSRTSDEIDQFVASGLLTTENVGALTWISQKSVLALLPALPGKGPLPEAERAAVRRTLLKNLGLGLLGCVLDRRMLQPLEASIAKALQGEPREHLQRMVGIDPTTSLSVSCGPVLRNLGDFHPDNRAGGSAILASLLPPNDRRVSLLFSARKGLRLEHGEGLLIAGGPVGCLYSRIAFEFEGHSPKRLVRRSRPIIPLRWYGLANELDPRVKELGRVSYVMEGVGTVFPNNWPLVDTISSRTWEVRTGRAIPGSRPAEQAYQLHDNYLTVTRMPNFLSPAVPKLIRTNTDLESWPQLVNLDGRNSIGTRGAELLTQSEGQTALRDALDATKRFGPSYQLLFRLTNLVSNGGFSRFSRISFVDAHELRLPPSVLSAAHRYAQRRLASEIA
jgi:hypothetical protein